MHWWCMCLFRIMVWSKLWWYLFPSHFCYLLIYCFTIVQNQPISVVVNSTSPAASISPTQQVSFSVGIREFREISENGDILRTIAIGNSAHNFSLSSNSINTTGTGFNPNYTSSAISLLFSSFFFKKFYYPLGSSGSASTSTSSFSFGSTSGHLTPEDISNSTRWTCSMLLSNEASVYITVSSMSAMWNLFFWYALVHCFWSARDQLYFRQPHHDISATYPQT